MPTCRQETTLTMLRHAQDDEPTWIIHQANGNEVDRGTGEFIFKRGRTYTLDGTRYIVSDIGHGREGLMNICKVHFSTFLDRVHGGEITELLKSDRSV
ncbi:hypothetical protein [Bacillus phage Hakuna]|uniref:Uncharacterized protein n=1 Tax=Bacillus phage Hakuna TaxID=1486659 RepID=A0A024B178_9CAUD|nr:hypothetical protein FP72_gp162 [Bacillus phage Hakuna]AHZ10180.1 hypothetical protein [Bacillus phage Hakuna]